MPGNGREELQFLIKQALDLGVYGVMISHVETGDEALAAVRACRFPQRRGAADFEPTGQRGVGYGWATRYWGLTGEQYAKKADLWPLDPEGELVLWCMVESVKGVENCRAIASTPGASGIFIGPSDLAFSMGLSESDPLVEKAILEVLAICKEVEVPCGALTSGEGVVRRLDQGFRFLAVGEDGGISAGVERSLAAGRQWRPKNENIAGR